MTLIIEQSTRANNRTYYRDARSGQTAGGRRTALRQGSVIRLTVLLELDREVYENLFWQKRIRIRKKLRIFLDFARA